MVTMASTTNFSSLNYDCLFEIFSQKSISITDLCSVARSSTTLKEIANSIYRRREEEQKIFSLNGHWHTIPEARRIVVTFGSIISRLIIDSLGVKEENKEEWENLLNLVARCCSETLDLLYLINLPNYLTIRISPLRKLKFLYIDYYYLENMKKIYVDSESLLELNIRKNFRIENTFPKLKKLRYDVHDPMHFTEFISRHKNLKSLSIPSGWDDPLSLFPIIADNCKELEEFYISITIGVRSDEFNQAIRRLQTLEYLRKLEIERYPHSVRSATSLLQELKYFNSLESLKLKYFIGDSESIPDLLQLKKLRELELNYCIKFPLNKLGDLHQLKKLSIDEVFNVVDLIKRLNNLETLTLGSLAFKIDKKLYLGIVNVIQSRPLRFPQNLELICYIDDDVTAGDLQYDVGNSRIVKLYSFQGDSCPPEELQTLQF